MFPVEKKSSCTINICWEHLCKPEFMLEIFLCFLSFKFKKSSLLPAFYLSSKVFWWRLFFASEKLFKVWATSLRALFECMCLDFLWGETTTFVFEQVLQRLYLLEFHLPNILLDFHFHQKTSLDFHRGFHYAHSLMRCPLHLKINWSFHLPHKKLDLNV